MASSQQVQKQIDTVLSGTHKTLKTELSKLEAAMRQRVAMAEAVSEYKVSLFKKQFDAEIETAESEHGKQTEALREQYLDSLHEKLRRCQNAFNVDLAEMRAVTRRVRRRDGEPAPPVNSRGAKGASFSNFHGSLQQAEIMEDLEAMNSAMNKNHSIRDDRSEASESDASSKPATKRAKTDGRDQKRSQSGSSRSTTRGISPVNEDARTDIAPPIKPKDSRARTITGTCLGGVRTREEAMGEIITVWYEETYNGRKVDVPYTGVVTKLQPLKGKNPDNYGLYVKFDGDEEDDEELVINNDDEWAWGKHQSKNASRKK